MTEQNALRSDEHAIGLRLSAQRALLRHIPAGLRAVSVEYAANLIRCRFIFGTEPTAHDRDLLSSAATEIIADYSAPFTISEEYLAVPYPTEMEHLSNLVFLRYEP